MACVIYMCDVIILVGGVLTLHVMATIRVLVFLAGMLMCLLVIMLLVIMCFIHSCFFPLKGYPSLLLWMLAFAVQLEYHNLKHLYRSCDHCI